MPRWVVVYVVVGGAILLPLFSWAAGPRNARTQLRLAHMRAVPLL